MKMLLVIFLMASLSSQASDKGNGGGGICTASGKCVTLAEAGFRFPIEVNQDVGTYDISYTVLEEIEKINALLPKDYRYFSVESVVGQPGDLVYLESVDEERTKKFLEEYRRILRNHASEDLASKVKVLAFTIDRKTYLIKDKYEALNTRSQALLLMHEYFLRLGHTLEFVMRVDGAVVDYLKAIETGSSPELGQFIKAFSLGKPDGSLILNESLKASASYLLNDEVIPEVLSQVVMKFSYESILRMNKYHPELREQLAVDTQYRVEIRNRHDYFYYALSDLADSAEFAGKRSFKLTNEIFEKVISSYKIPESLRLCSSFTDKSMVLTSNSKANKYTPAIPDLVLCNGLGLNPKFLRGSRGGLISFDFNQSIFSNVSGLSLNLSKQMKCNIYWTNGTVNGIPTKEVSCQ